MKKIISKRMGSGREQISEVAVTRHYISVVAQKIQSLLDAVEEYKQHDYTSLSPITLSEIVSRILNRFFEDLRRTSSKIDEDSSQDILAKVQTINFVVITIVPQLIQAIKSAENSSPIASILQAYEKIIDRINFSTQTIIHPAWEYNATYDEILTSLRNMTRYLDSDASTEIFSGSPQYFVIITYPQNEEEIVLRQALIAHEIGHFVNSTRGWGRELLDGKIFDLSDLEILKDEIRKQYPNKNLEEKDVGNLYARYVRLLNKIITNWIMELVSDFVAVCILGPAFLFAFDEITVTPDLESIRRISLTHPPSVLRKHAIAKAINYLHIDPMRNSDKYQYITDREKEYLDKIEKWTEKISNYPQLDISTITGFENINETIVKVLYSALLNAYQRANLELYQEKPEEIASEDWICTARDLFDALSLQEFLHHDLTPTELTRSSSRDPTFAAVMNSGWIHMFLEESKYQFFSGDISNSIDHNEPRERYLTLQNLIAKAVESLQFKREFHRRKGEER